MQPPSALAQAPAPGRKGGPPWGVLRYTTDSSYVVRTVTRGPDRIAVNRAAARRITELPEFRGRGPGRARHGSATARTARSRSARGWAGPRSGCGRATSST
ncbi:hypothetical protein [Streptomyces heilongjiangensis]|uniref:Uncharacterized protein n=1 Tax=Streptomyces heilongjiangensis TaxID=945052 RepID=A0ABW1BEK1_9ACTN